MDVIFNFSLIATDNILWRMDIDFRNWIFLNMNSKATIRTWSAHRIFIIVF